MPEEQYPEMHVQESLPVTSQEKSDLTEDVLEINDDLTKHSVAKESQIDNTLIIRKSLEKGVSLPITNEVCNIYESKDLSTNSFHLISIIHLIQFDNSL